ncbi:hypothetical protein GW17_00033070 [Ensete ventricosum]|nr:hypothetical protein GW17_00033070 [Ensete ventricosum]
MYQTSPRSVPPRQLATSGVSGQTQQPTDEQYPLTPDSWRQAVRQGGRTATSSDHGGDLTHMGNLNRVICHPTLRDDPNSM